MGQRRWLAAGSLLVASAIVPIAFSLFLVGHGLPFLPNSVLAKTGAYGSGHHNLVVNILITALVAVTDIVSNYSRKIELMMILAFAWLAWKTSGPRRWPLLGVLLTLTIHFLVGHFNWFHRYEIFSILFGAVVLYRATAPLQGRWFLYGVIALSVAALPYFRDTWRIPIASRNIYDQQYQMHRFVDGYYQKTFAVNDLGWVSFQLDPSIYVLDLYGLASNEALRQRTRDAAWLDRITHEHRVGLVMIYPGWYPDIPRDWTPMGALSLLGTRVTPAGNQVMFYVTPDGDKAGVLRELKSFAGTLPPDAFFQFAPGS
jgi:hypothetical protein